MIKKVLLFAFVAFVSLQSNAQDAKAKQVLDAVSAKLKSLKSLKANFALNISKTKQKKTGTIAMKGNKYNVNIAGGQQIFCNNTTVWTYTKSTNEVQISDLDPTENTFTPAKLFSNFYDKEYKSKFVAEKKIGTKIYAIIELTPIKVKQFTKIELQVDKALNFITNGKVFEKNGNVITYTISGISENTAIADNTFTFDAKKYPGVEVVDLR